MSRRRSRGHGEIVLPSEITTISSGRSAAAGLLSVKDDCCTHSLRHIEAIAPPLRGLSKPRVRTERFLLWQSFCLPGVMGIIDRILQRLLALMAQANAKF
jgi:hypothetical protein